MCLTPELTCKLNYLRVSPRLAFTLMGTRKKRGELDYPVALGNDKKTERLFKKA